MQGIFRLPLVVCAMVAWALGGTGCFASHDPWSDPEAGARFEGLWAVENGLTYAYEGSLYDFRPDGSLVRLRDVAAGYRDAWQVGRVSLSEIDDACMTTGMGCPVLVRCLFGHHWRTDNPTRVVIELGCDDNGSRAAEILFETDVAQNASGATVQLLSVDGESYGWFLEDARVFRKCPSEVDCLRSE